MPMRLYEKCFDIVAENNSFLYFQEAINKQLTRDEIPIRFVITHSSKEKYSIELGVLSGNQKQSGSIFDFNKRSFENTEQFNAALIIPTGIGAEIGGHAGDATAVANLLASVCDNLILHPNVVNASDINEMAANALYVEGSILTRLLMGTIGLQKVRNNRVLCVLDDCSEQYFVSAAINSINAARATYGLECPKVIRLNSPFKMRSLYSSSNRAIGEIKGLKYLCKVLEEHASEYDAIAFSSKIEVPAHFHTDYYKCDGKMVNPWGGVEAILTHAISHLYNVPAAHSPMFESIEISDIDLGIVDPRMAAETVSVTFLQCILKGLQRSPKIISNIQNTYHPSMIQANDISCLIIPDHCIGLPTLAALEQGIKVIAVRNNSNHMKNDLHILPWKTGQLHIVENYFEAVGVMAAIKAGIAPKAIARPIEWVKVEKKHFGEAKIAGQ